jgi:hypothetical protein
VRAREVPAPRVCSGRPGSIGDARVDDRSGRLSDCTLPLDIYLFGAFLVVNGGSNVIVDVPEAGGCALPRPASAGHAPQPRRRSRPLRQPIKVWTFLLLAATQVQRSRHSTRSTVRSASAGSAGLSCSGRSETSLHARRHVKGPSTSATLIVTTLQHLFSRAGDPC